MADYERTVLDYYQLTTAYPVEWPAEKDMSDASDEEDKKSNRNGMVRRSKSRYSALERAASDRRSILPGSQKTADSVVRILRQLNLNVEDTRLRG